MVNIKQLEHYTQQLMQVERLKDYCPNGLQVEGKPEIHKIVTGVTASMALIEAAHQAGADLIMVHHGYFWRNEDVRVVGMKRRRLGFLMQHNLNLMAYHLPLDVHAELGNNVQLGMLLGLAVNGYAGDSGLVAYADIEQPINLGDFVKHLELCLKRKALVVGDPSRLVKKVVWCTGAAQAYIDIAFELGADVYISGEISEQTVHQANEMGVAYIAAGHHATERYGIRALGQHLAQKFDLEHEFIDVDNPV